MDEPMNQSSSDQANYFAALLNQLCPRGTIVLYIGDDLPPGWLVCDGSEVSRETWPGLFGLFGTRYGAGDGSTTYNLPDLASPFPHIKYIIRAGVVTWEG